MAANDNSAGQQSSGSQNGTLGSLDSTNQGAADSRENKPGKEPWWEWLKPFRLLLIPFILLLISAYFQVSDTLENTQKISIERTAIVTSQVDGELVLHIAAPADLDYQEPGNAKAPLSVWLSYASPYPSPTPTFNGPTATSMPVSPTPTQNAVGGAVVTSTEAPPTATPTAYSYLLNLGVSWDAITFTDKDGRSVSGQIALTPSRFGVTPEVLYLQLNANSPNVALTIVPSIRDANGFQILPAFSVEPETKNAAWWRLFLSLTLTPTLIGTLLVTVTTLAIQQWGKAEDDRAKKKKEEDNERIIRKNTLDELEKKQRAQVESLTTLIKEKPADAARLYLGFMKLCENKDRVKAAWAAASEELKNLVELEYASRDEKELTNLIYKLGQEKVEQALKHAIQHRLDEEWENRADVIAQAVFRQKPEYWEGQLLSYLFAIDRPREALLKAWPNISYWRLRLTSDQVDTLQKKWDFYAQATYPLGAPHAEENTWLFNNSFGGTYYPFDAMSDIQKNTSGAILGSPHWGKTSTAFWLLEYALQTKTIFPIYLSVSAGITLADISRLIARILLHYLAINPSAYLRRGLAGRASIAHLFANYIGAGAPLKLALWQAGLSRTGTGLNVVKELENLLSGYRVASSQTEDEMLSILSESYPDGFTTTWLLLDVQRELTPDADLAQFSRLVHQLNHIGLKTKIFLSAEADKWPELDIAPISVRKLKWENEALKGLINLRLVSLGEDKLDSLCKPDTSKGDSTPEARLIEAARTQPGLLVQKGNALLKRFGQNQKLLSNDDLDEILGPLSLIHPTTPQP